mmetsp:Transcript_59449/g.140642  ORF Transcript_59449/g.140642 Transcript_59449/m.140642 type:complete len:246 (-) Transcript_59449:2653-3390(-)
MVTHPSWRLGLGASDQRKGQTDADGHGVQVALVRFHPELLLGAAQSNEDDLGAGAVDGVDDGGVERRLGRQHGRRHRAGNAQARNLLKQASLHQAEFVRRATVKKDWLTTPSGRFADSPHQPRAVDTARPVLTVQPLQGPDQGHAIGHDGHSLPHQAREPWGALGAGKHVHVCDAHQAALTAGAPVADELHCRSHIAHVYADSEQSGGLEGWLGDRCGHEWRQQRITMVRRACWHCVNAGGVRTS